MSCKNSQDGRISHVVATFGLLAALLATSVGSASEAATDATGLVGTWAVQVTLRDCATAAPQGSFSSLVTFHRGGTVSEAAGSRAFAVGQRTTAQGTWVRKGETFRQRMIALIIFETAANLPGTPTFDPNQPISPGFRAGWQTVRHTITLVDDDRYTSRGENAFYDATGAAYRSGCSTATAERFK